MKNKKLLFLLGIFLITCLASVFSVFAHPGSLDENGGHWDRSNGTYHFHEGKNTSGGGSHNPDYKYPYSDFEPPYEPPTDNPYKSDKNDEAVSNTDSGIKEILENILTVVICIWYIGVFVFLDFEKSDGCFTFGISAILIVCIVGYLIEERTELFFGLILIAFIFIPLILKLKKKYTVAITGMNYYLNSFYRLSKYHKELSQIETQIEMRDTDRIPDLYEIGNDNLPKVKGCFSDWGETFTLYKTYQGTKLHARHKCCSADNPAHIYWYRNYRDFSELLCKKCANSYIMPDMSWYEDYLKREQAKTKRENIESNCKKLQKEIEDLHRECNSTKTKFLIMFSRKNKKALQEANKKYEELINGKQFSLFN